MAELIKMLFVLWTMVGPGNHVLGELLLLLLATSNTSKELTVGSTL